MFVLLVVARWLHFCAISVVFGGSIFGLATSGTPVATARERSPSSRVWPIRLLDGAAVAAAVSGVASLAATIANATGGLASLGDPDLLGVFFFATPFGPWSILRVVLLLLLAALALVPLAPRVRLAANAGIAGALLVSQAWLGHAVEGGATQRGVMMLAAYAVHVTCAAAWVGSLPSLCFALAEPHGGEAGDEGFLMRYSAWAQVAVALIVGSGVANTAFHTGRPAQLVTSEYGGILAAKLVLVAAMLVLAARNRFVVLPRLRCGRDARAIRGLRTSVAVETVLAALVLAAAALLGVSPPPR